MAELSESRGPSWKLKLQKWDCLKCPLWEGGESIWSKDAVIVEVLPTAERFWQLLEFSKSNLFPATSADDGLKSSASKGALEVLATWKVSSSPLMPGFLDFLVSSNSLDDGRILLGSRALISLGSPFLGRSSFQRFSRNSFVLLRENALTKHFL